MCRCIPSEYFYYTCTCIQDLLMFTLCMIVLILSFNLTGFLNSKINKSKKGIIYKIPKSFL